MFVFACVCVRCFVKRKEEEEVEKEEKNKQPKMTGQKLERTKRK